MQIKFGPWTRTALWEVSHFRFCSIITALICVLLNQLINKTDDRTENLTNRFVISKPFMFKILINRWYTALFLRSKFFKSFELKVGINKSLMKLVVFKINCPFLLFSALGKLETSSGADQSVPRAAHFPLLFRFLFILNLTILS